MFCRINVQGAHFFTRAVVQILSKHYKLLKYLHFRVPPEWHALCYCFMPVMNPGLAATYWVNGGDRISR